jgi:pyridoxal phosphate enzyme (YggS family)
VSIAEALAATRKRIDDAARASGRDPATVKLVAASKTKPAAMIREAYAAGQRDFGENYAQELAEKAQELADLTEIRWHFIGHLQSNKAKLVAPVAHMVHAVDSASLASALAKRASKALQVLIEVNVAGEAEKHGIAPAELPALITAIRAEQNLALVGLMTMPPHETEATRQAFAGLASLGRENGLAQLSMGMTDDLELAVAAGATMVRIGTAIFGAR